MPAVLNYQLYVQEQPSTTTVPVVPWAQLEGQSVLTSGPSIGKAAYFPDVGTLGLQNE